MKTKKVFSLWFITFIVVLALVECLRAEILEPVVQLGHNSCVKFLAFYPGGRYLASGIDDKTIKVWDLKTGHLVNTLKKHKDKDRVNSVALSLDGRYLASGCDDMTIKIWEVKTWRLVRTLNDGHKNIRYLTFSPDGRYLASGSCSGRWNEYSVVNVWDVKTAHLVTSINREYLDIDHVVFSPDGHYLAAPVEVNYHTAVAYWNLQDSMLEFVVSTKKNNGYPSDIKTVTFSPDGRYLATETNDKTIKLY
jgi:WD40 repeat protein